MGWEHSHLYQFIADTVRYGEPDPEYDDDMQSDRRGRLRDIARGKRASLRYEDDFCDGWVHLLNPEENLAPVGLHLVSRGFVGGGGVPPRGFGGGVRDVEL